MLHYGNPLQSIQFNCQVEQIKKNICYHSNLFHNDFYSQLLIKINVYMLRVVFTLSLCSSDYVFFYVYAFSNICTSRWGERGCISQMAVMRYSYPIALCLCVCCICLVLPFLLLLFFLFYMCIYPRILFHYQCMFLYYAAKQAYSKTPADIFYMVLVGLGYVGFCLFDYRKINRIVVSLCVFMHLYSMLYIYIYLGHCVCLCI